MVPRTLIMNAVFKFSYIDKIISLGCADEMGVIFPERGGGELRGRSLHALTLRQAFSHWASVP
jgi:hypothetical protein